MAKVSVVLAHFNFSSCVIYMIFWDPVNTQVADWNLSFVWSQFICPILGKWHPNLVHVLFQIISTVFHSWMSKNIDHIRSLFWTSTKKHVQFEKSMETVLTAFLTYLLLCVESGYLFSIWKKVDWMISMLEVGFSKKQDQQYWAKGILLFLASLLKLNNYIYLSFLTF